MHKQYQSDSTLLNYLQTLQVQSKFKAKIIYTLACIHNYLEASPQSKYATNIFTICSAKEQLLTLVQLHADCSVLEPLSSLFVKLQKSTVNPSSSRQFLNKILNLNMQTQLTTHFTQNICALLYILQHLYPDTKKLCMKLICTKNISKVQSKLLMDVINFQCKLNLKQICQIGQKGNIAVDDMLKTMWKICSVGFNGNKDIQNIIKKYLNQRWWDQRLKSMCVAVFIANSANQQGAIQELNPNFISQFYKCNPKPFYIFHLPELKFQDFSQIFPHIASYVSSELLVLDPIKYPAFIKSLSSILPHQFAANSDYNQIIKAIFDNKQPANNLQSKYCSLIPVEAICIKDNNLTDLYIKINKQIALGNGYYALQKLLTDIKGEVKKFTEIQWRLCLLLLIISLENKKHLYLKAIQKIIHFSYQNSNIFHSLISSNLNSLTFLPILFYSQNSFKNYPKDKLDYLYKSIDKFMNNQEIKLYQKFYVVEKFIKMRYLPGVSKFVYFLLRKLPQQKIGFQEIFYYLKHRNWTQKDTQWILQNFGEQLESILQKVFSQLAFSQFKAPRSIIFALQKYQVFQSWSQSYRWALNPLDQPNFNNPQALVDCFQILQTIIENCKKVPIQLIKKFFYIITKHWQNYNHNHMFTIQRISNTLFSEQQFTSTDLQELSLYLKSLPSSRSFSAPNKQIYNLSLTLLISNTLLQQTSDIDIALTQQINSILSPGKMQSYLKSYEGTKNILFTLQTLMWKYQYQEEIIDDKIAEGLIKILNNFNKLQIPNEPDRQKIVQVALQALSSVGHNCNLLDIGLANILSSYIMNVRIIQISTQIITNVKQANLKAISKFKLQRLILILLSSLFINNCEQLTLAHLSLLEQLISSKQLSPYYSVIAKNSPSLIQILRSQAIFVYGKYTPQIVKFALEWVINLGILDRISKKWIQMLWIKYWYEQKIRIMCEKIIGNLGDKKIILQKTPKVAEQVLQNITKQDNLVERKLPQQTQKQEVQSDYIKQNLNQNIQELPNAKIQEQISTKSIIEINKNEEKQELQHIPQNISQKIPQRKQVANQKKQNQFQIHIKQENQILNTSQVTSPKINSLNLNIGTIQQKDVNNFPQYKPPTLHPKSQSPFHSDFGGAGTGSAKKKKSAQAVQREEQVQNINSIKGYVQYIGSLVGIEINQDQYNKLKESFKYLTQAVQIHQYYCQKIVNFGIVSKCLALHLETQKKLIQDILKLFQQIGFRKQKNLLIFNDSNSINFFKNTLKNSLLVQKQLPTTSQVIRIVNNCWSTYSQFFSAGLISMLLEMAKIPLNRVQILELLSSPNNELSYQIVNEIYQRGLLNVLENTIKMKTQQMNQNDKLQLVLWGRLIGKVCVNGSIRQKLWSIGFHAKIWEKKKIFEQKGCQQNLAYFYGSFCYQFEKLALWCIQQKIPQYLFTTLQSYQNLTPIEFYKFFRYFAQNGNYFVQHLFRIQLHTYFISILPILKAKLKNQWIKHYYKCFAHMFTPERYQIFIKVQLIKNLVKKYKDQHSCYILECLQKLIAQIKQKKQLEVLQKQDFYTINTVFNSKIKDDLSYPYIIQAYITLLRKFKKFQTRYLNLDLVHQIIRKAIYSINMQGKKKTIQFLIQFSDIDKVYYGNANVMVLLQSLLSYNTGQQQLQLTCNYLSIEAKYKRPSRASQQLKSQQQQKYPMRFKNVVSIPCDDLLNTLLCKFQQLKQQSQKNESLSKNNQKSLIKILQILQYFKKNESNSINIFQKIGTLLIKSNDKVIKYDDSLPLINQLLSWKIIQNRYKSLGDTLLNYIKSVAQYLGQNLDKKSQVFQLYAKILQRCLKTNVIAELQFQKFCRQFLKNHKIASTQPIKRFLKLCLDYKSNDQITSTMKNIMTNGIRVKLYKPDGSNSNLLLFFTDDLFEINCANNLNQPVKSKWKMGVVEITDILVYQTEADYKNSTFYLSEGVFTKAPPMQNCLTLQSHSKNLYVSFDTNIQLKQWMKYIEMAKNQAQLILLKVSQSYI